MKVLMVLDRPNLYGSELHFLDLADHFNTIAQVKVVVLSNGPLLHLLKEKNIPYTIIPSGWVSIFSFVRKFISILKTFAPHIVHSHQPKANFLIAIVKCLRRFQSIVTIHSQAVDHSLIHQNTIKRKIVFLFHRIVQYVAEWQSNQVVYVSKAASSTTFFRKKVIIIYNWLRKDRLVNQSTRGISGQVIKMVSVGSVTYAKGYDLLIDFVERFKPGSVQLDIVGSDNSDFAQELKQKLRKKNIITINFHDYQSDTGTWLNSADFYVLFSRSETFGLSYVEAMAAGLPVLALDYPTMQEIIPIGNSLSNKLSDHEGYIRLLHTDEEQYRRISENNSRYVANNYSYPAAMKQYEKLYNKVMRLF